MSAGQWARDWADRLAKRRAERRATRVERTLKRNAAKAARLEHERFGETRDGGLGSGPRALRELERRGVRDGDRGEGRWHRPAGVSAPRKRRCAKRIPPW